MLTAQDNATIVRAHYDAYNRRDLDKSLALVTDDVKLMNIPFNVNYAGKKGYREFIENWTNAMPDSKVEVVNVVSGDVWTAVEFIARGTHSGPLVGPLGTTLPPTQKKLDLKFCELFRINDGQIAESHLYFDAATMLRQFGLLPQNQTLGQPAPVPSGR